jgi:hypothetical protein
MPQSGSNRREVERDEPLFEVHTCNQQLFFSFYAFDYGPKQPKDVRQLYCNFYSECLVKPVITETLAVKISHTKKH